MKRTIMLLMAVLLIWPGGLLTAAMADTAVKDGIRLTVTTQQDQYDAWEPLKAAVTILNTNDFTVKDAVLQLSASPGYQFIQEKQVELGDLEPGEMYQLNLTAVDADACPPIPQTGDDFPLLPLVLGLTAALGSLMILHKKGLRRPMAMLLCFMLLGSAAQTDIIRKSFKVTAQVKAGDERAQITATLYYDFEGTDPFEGHTSGSRNKRPASSSKPLDLSQYITYPELVDLNLMEGVTITAQGLPRLMPYQAVYVYADCSFVLTTPDGSAEVPFILRVGDEVVDPQGPAVIFTEDGSAVVTIQLQPPKDMACGVYNGVIEFRTKTVTNHSPGAYAPA